MRGLLHEGLDPQLWHACAGALVQIPQLNSKVIYFPQGHAEHASLAVEFPDSPIIPAVILCRVAAINFLADKETDEVYVKLRLVPLSEEQADIENDGVMGSENLEKPASFAKTLTQSDANNGGGFSVPRYCAETIFPRLDYTADPPVQSVVAKDVHGETWKFRHIYRGTPRRHLLTTGWSTFVNQKKLVAGDSIVFMRAENGDLCVGIRRAKRGMGCSMEIQSGWTSGSGSCVHQYGVFPMLLREEDGKLMQNGMYSNVSLETYSRGRGKVRPESVVQAAVLAATGQPFEVVYYPRVGTPEFFVKASSVQAAMGIQWFPRMRFKMAFETEDSSRISWFVGTISSIKVCEPIRWPKSPWRILQVTWDEPDLLQNVTCINPWSVELASTIPAIQIPPFSPPRKKLCLPQPPTFPFDGQFIFPPLSGNPLRPSSPMCCLPGNTPAGIQGARQAQFGISLSDLHLNSKTNQGTFPSNLQLLDPPSRDADMKKTVHKESKESLSCLLTMGSPEQSPEKVTNGERRCLVLFGKSIIPGAQMSPSCSSEISDMLSEKVQSNENSEKVTILSNVSGSSLKQQPEKAFLSGFSWHLSYQTAEEALDFGHCKVFLESEDVGRTLDLSAIGSYEELYRKLAYMFGIERSDTMRHVVYRDAIGTVRRIGDEPFSDFIKTARRMYILMGSGKNNIARMLVTGIPSAEKGLDSSTNAGPLSTCA